MSAMLPLDGNSQRAETGYYYNAYTNGGCSFTTTVSQSGTTAIIGAAFVNGTQQTPSAYQIWAR